MAMVTGSGPIHDGSEQGRPFGLYKDTLYGVLALSAWDTDTRDGFPWSLWDHRLHITCGSDTAS